MSNYIRTGRLMYPLGDPSADLEHGITGAAPVMLTAGTAALTAGAGGGVGTPSEGLPSWVLPVAIGGGLLYFLTRR